MGPRPPDDGGDDGKNIMKLVRFSVNGRAAYGLIEGDRIIELGEGDTRDFIATAPRAKALNLASRPSHALKDVTLLAPIARPGKIFAIGLNYADHIAESGVETPKEQVWFTKAVTAINAPFAPVQIPKASPFVDYEVELVAVIGKGGKHISREAAPAHVFGYCVGNDVTERLWQHRTPQWSLGKSFDTHAPIGPWITTADEVGDPHTLDLKCFVNGAERQGSNTRHLVFNLWDQIAQLSAAMTLEPGDLIFTGTPGGIGAAMDPRQFLKAGDVVRCEIEKLGHIEAVMAAES
jgi:2-keto-4-pentenoate hydratase/2-oxohepta-3-ene-1,7-dioic acid hydratase in catechol pathway